MCGASTGLQSIEAPRYDPAASFLNWGLRDSDRAMPEKIVLVTGSLAEPRLQRLSNEPGDDDTEITVSNIGVKVAALMTTKIVERRLTLPTAAERVIMPGRFRGDLERLSDFFGTRFERGPDELADLPEYLGRASKPVDLTRHDVLIFAEIVDATLMSPEQTVERARLLQEEGADVIDLGCLPDTISRSYRLGDVGERSDRFDDGRVAVDVESGLLKL
jgi:hypothetical protein